MRYVVMLVLAGCSGGAGSRPATSARTEGPADAAASVGEAAASEIDCSDLEARQDDCPTHGGFGFGRSGYGPGGCPTGWGMIHTGSGGSVELGALASSLRASDRAAIRAFIDERGMELRNCYQGALIKDPKVAGSVIVRVCIATNGSTLTDATGIGNAELERCLADAVGTIQFAPTTAATRLGIAVPLMLRTR